MRPRRLTERCNDGSFTAFGRRRAQTGFTLLEILAAITIFTLMAVFTVASLDRSTDNALSAIRARELRFLAERRLGEIIVFEKEYDDIFTDNFSDYHDDYADWEWKLDIRDVVVFGESGDEDAQYLFGAPDEDDTTADAQGPQEAQGETQFLRELTLTVTAPSEDGEGDSVSVVLFLPLVDHGAPTGAPGGGNDNTSPDGG